MKKKIMLESIVSQDENQMSVNVDGEFLMMSIENGEYYSMDTVGSRIWELIKKPISINELCKKLTNEYNVSDEQCKNEVFKFLDKVNELGLLNVN